MGAYVFQDEELPSGFRFPASYLSGVSKIPIPYPEPWWYLSEFPEQAKWWLRQLKQMYSQRSLVPFAKYDTYDDIACFDGRDTTGDPMIQLVHYGATPGWEDRGRLQNFEAWLQRAQSDTKEWHSDAG